MSNDSIRIFTDVTGFSSLNWLNIDYLIGFIGCLHEFEDMRVKVRMLGVLSDSAGVSEVDLDLSEGSDIGALLNELITSYQNLRGDIWDPVVDSPEPNALILYNGVEVNNLQGLSTRITEGSEVVLLAVTHGG